MAKHELRYGMLGLSITALAVLFSALIVFGCSKNTAQNTALDTTEETDPAADWELISEAYVYAFPLVLMNATMQVSTNTEYATHDKAPINQLIHSQTLADATSKEVVTPNVDTLYSRASLDLGDEALVFHKPAADRFLSVEILDYYTNSTAILGTGSDDQADGSSNQEAQTYLITGPDFAGEVPADMTQVSIPTQNAWIIIRTVTQGVDDFPAVYALQEQMVLMPLSAYLANDPNYRPATGSYSPERDFIPIEYVLSLSPEAFFMRANELMLTNPPSSADAALMERLATIGVGPGLTFDQAILGSDATQKWKDMLAGLESDLTAQSQEFVVTQGAWDFYGEPIAEFGTEYAFRALVALGGLGANPVSVAVYPKAEVDDTGKPLDGANDYVIHFEKDQLPPVKEYGFWSITAYGEDDFLIENELDRYLINDRSQLSYNEDGSLDILVQAQAPTDESMRGNWLPVKEEAFHLYLRIYLPAEEVLAQTWNTPAITPTSTTAAR